MKYYSTNYQSESVELREALFLGLACDGGLFLPERLDPLPSSFLKALASLSFEEIAFTIADRLLDAALPKEDLQALVQQAINFPAPLIPLKGQIYSLELFHGPTLSFKDFGARFMASLIAYFSRDQQEDRHILVATSGDTGSAVASAFEGVPGIRVWILFPKGKVSEIQERQLTTISGGNVTALEVSGSFDDCQALVKQAFNDQSLRDLLSLTSANSINIARLIPQSFYYFAAYAQLPQGCLPPVFSVPSGNFGNLTAGLIAKRLGVPVHRFVAATNINDSIPRYLQTGVFQPHPSHSTLSNAMDVGNPSNFSRMLALYEGEHAKLCKDLFGVSFTDDQTREAIDRVFSEQGYLLDPHGAVAYLGLEAYRKTFGASHSGIFLETAHPAKFLTESLVQIPERLAHCLSQPKRATPLSTNYEELKQLLLR